MSCFGSRLVVDLYADELSADKVNATTLKIERKTDRTWTLGGPAYLMPIIEVVGNGGVLNTGGEFKMNAALSGTTLTKRGSGCLFLKQSGSLERLVMTGGDVAIQHNTAVRSIEIQSGTLWDDVQATTQPIHVPHGKTGTRQLTGKSTYSGATTVSAGTLQLSSGAI